MSSSEGKLTDSYDISQRVQNSTTIDGEKSLDSQQIFEFIESLLPLEVCLHYQVLPLELNKNRLLLGMVYPEDNTALEYVGRMVSYLGCTIHTKAIAVNIHQDVLSAYLRYKNTTTSNRPTPPPTTLEILENTSISTEDISDSKGLEDSIILDFESIQQKQLGNGENINSQVDENKAIAQNINTEANQLQTNNNVLQSANISNSQGEAPKNLPLLSLPEQEQLNPVEVLATLTPKQVLIELLARIITSGIGRLYLQREPYAGRITWSNNGVIQSTLENLPLSTYQGIINELKRLCLLSLNQLDLPKQVEKEYLYHDKRLLIRLRIMAAEHGEEATLQVLKGAALQYYHQRQIERLSNDSLKITQKLTDKLHQLRNRLLVNSNSEAEKLIALDKLNQLLDKLDYQIKILSIPSEG